MSKDDEIASLRSQLREMQLETSIDIDVLLAKLESSVSSFNGLLAQYSKSLCDLPTRTSIRPTMNISPGLKCEELTSVKSRVGELSIQLSISEGTSIASPPQCRKRRKQGRVLPIDKEPVASFGDGAASPPSRVIIVLSPTQKVDDTAVMTLMR